MKILQESVMILTWNLDQWLNLTKDTRQRQSANCDVIVFFPIYGQFAAIRKSDFRRMVYKTYIFVNNNILSYKSWKQN